MSLVDSKRQSEQAKAISDIALSKERFTRSIANLGLEDERAARAIDDRASAALDRAKAITELSKIDDERLVKYLGIVQMMEEMNRVKEEQIKSDDVETAARGMEQAASPQANPLGDESMLQETLQTKRQHTSRRREVCSHKFGTIRHGSCTIRKRW